MSHQVRLLGQYSIEKDCYEIRLDVLHKETGEQLVVWDVLAGVWPTPPNTDESNARAAEVLMEKLPRLLFTIASEMKARGWKLSDVVVPAMPDGFHMPAWMQPSKPMVLPL